MIRFHTYRGTRLSSRWLYGLSSHCNRSTVHRASCMVAHTPYHTSEDLLARMGTRLERHISRGKPFHLERKTKWQERQVSFLSWFTSRSFRDVVRNFILRPCEVINTAWLVYIIMAQSVFPSSVTEYMLTG